MTTIDALPAQDPRPRLAARVTPTRLREMLLAAAIVLAASAILHAQDAMTGWTQDWVPEILAVPQDAELLTDRAVGSTIRLFSFSTGQNIDGLFRAWETALRDGGYQIHDPPSDLVGRSIEFSGTGIANAQIIAGHTTEDGRTVIEVDATLD